SHNHQTSKFYSEDLPVYISPGSSTEISLFFKSNEEGQFKDVLILNFDNEDKTTITIIPDQELDELQRYFIRQKANLLENYTGNLIHYSDFSFFTTGLKVGTYDPQPEKEIHIYPNPAENMVYIASSTLNIRKADLYSENGKLVFSHQYDQKNISINIGHLPAGIYTTLVYLIDNHSIMKHIVKY
ncbi:MAG: T9SS type A sorting domain-containing protein, partial [Bacteroidales bacterium]